MTLFLSRNSTANEFSRPFGPIAETLERREFLSVTPSQNAPELRLGSSSAAIHHRVAFGIASLTLINASSDQAIGVIQDGDTIDLAQVGSTINIRADASGSVGSVKFLLDGKVVRVESTQPFAFMSDQGGNYAPWTPAAGMHTVTAAPYSGASASGTAGTAFSRSFSVAVSQPPPPPPPSGNFPTVVTWTTIANSPIPRAEAVGTVVNNKLYVMGGFFGIVKGTKDHYIAQARCDAYDLANGKWTRLANMPEPFTHSTAVVVGDTLWFAGGYVGNHEGPGTTHVWKYSTSKNAWSRGPDLPIARGAGAAALIGNTLYFSGGMDRTRSFSTSDLYALDLNNQSAGWKKKTSAPTTRNHTGGIALNGKFYVIGGQKDQEEHAISLAAVEVYDPVTDKWSTVKSLPQARSHLTNAIFVYKGRILAIGGESKFSTPHREILAYDPASNSWSIMGYLPASRSTVVAGMFSDGRIISATGNAPSGSQTSWIGIPK